MNFLSEDELSLGRLRSVLIRLEDTIIFGLIERAQFKLNERTYQPNGFDFSNDFQGSFLDFFLFETESLHAKVRRYTSPDEYPFSANLPQPILAPLTFPEVFKPHVRLNMNDEIKKMYLDSILPGICEMGDDLNYGSSAVCDTEILQALSKRIHYGKFIAEAKYLNPETQAQYIDLIKKKDEDGLMELLTNAKVEERLLARLKKKALMYGQDVTETEVDPLNLKIQPEKVAQLYEDFVIPLTKKLEVEYLLRRLDSDVNSSDYFKPFETDARL